MQTTSTLAGAIAAAIATMTANAAAPWSVEAPKPATKAPHVLVIYDMEGLAGQDDVDSFVPSNPAYPHASACSPMTSMQS